MINRKILKENWILFKDKKSLNNSLAKEVLHIAGKAIGAKGSFSIVLTGGNSVLELYKILSISHSVWDKWHIYLTDERCLPINDKDRNDHVINGVWLNNGKIPTKNIHFIKTELGCDASANNYEKELKNVKSFDIVLLSIGEDGHAASLFPNHQYDISKNVVVENDSPKYPKDRVSMSFSRLNQADNVFKVVNGVSKQRAVDLWLQENNLPIGQITGLYERVYICKDALPASLAKFQVN